MPRPGATAIVCGEFGSLRPSSHLVELDIDFLAEAHYPGSIEVGTAVSRVGTSACTIGQATFKDGDCVMSSQAVTVKVMQGRTVAFTNSERDLLAEYVCIAPVGGRTPAANTPGSWLAGPRRMDQRSREP